MVFANENIQKVLKKTLNGSKINLNHAADTLKMPKGRVGHIVYEYLTMDYIWIHYFTAEFNRISALNQIQSVEDWYSYDDYTLAYGWNNVIYYTDMGKTTNSDC